MGRVVRIGHVSIAIFAGVVLRWAPARAEITIDRHPEVVERRTFDPRRPPAAMPPLGPHEAAVTQSQFDCGLKLGYEVEEHRSDTGRCTAVLHVQSVTATLQLKIVVWLPTGASPRLIAHEEGHRQIDQRMYQEAADVARTLAGKIDGKTLTGEGDDCASAGQKAANDAANQFCHQYLDRVAGRASEINNKYDDLTAHGTKAEPTADEAIRQAFAKSKRASHSHATTQK